VSNDEEDLMAERETDERPQEAPLQENAELPVELPAPEMDSARPAAEAEEAPVGDAAEADLQPELAEPFKVSPLTPEATSAQVAAVDSEVEDLAAPASEEGPEPEIAELAGESAKVSEPVMAGGSAPSAADAQPAMAEGSMASTGEAVPATAEAPGPSGTPAEVAAEAAWYVIHCYSGYENKVRHNLEQRIETMGMKDRIFDVVIPTQEEIEVRDGKRRTVERHIFPGYVLVNMALSEESWYVVRNTPGVTGFVGMGNLPTALRPEEVAQIVKRMEADAPTVKVSFKVGERVRIVDGPFNDFRGTVADIDMERTKVRVMVSFFGRETPVELDFLQVEKA
jgi:transcriptional antiterminator NusG